MGKPTWLTRFTQRSLVQSFSSSLSAQGYFAGWFVVRHLPEHVAYRFFDFFADRVWRGDGKQVRQLKANLAQVTGLDVASAQLDDLTRQGMRSYLRYWCDVFRLPAWDRQRIHSSVELVGGEHLQSRRAVGKPFIGALPHMGNWDHVGAFAALEGFPITTVAERLKPERLYDRFVQVRRQLKIDVLALGGAEVFRGLRQASDQGRSVCLLADRDLPRSGVPVQFFGLQASMPPGPALLALQTGLPLHPVSTSYVLPETLSSHTKPFPRTSGQHQLKVHVHSPVEPPQQGTTRQKVAVMTQQVADTFAQAIAADPADWHMVQRLWPSVGPAPHRSKPLYKKTFPGATVLLQGTQKSKNQGPVRSVSRRSQA